MGRDDRTAPRPGEPERWDPRRKGRTMAIALVSEREAWLDELVATPWPRPSLTVVADEPQVSSALTAVTVDPARERLGHPRPRTSG